MDGHALRGAAVPRSVSAGLGRGGVGVGLDHQEARRPHQEEECRWAGRGVTVITRKARKAPHAGEKHSQHLETARS